MTSWFSMDAELLEPVAMSSGDHSRNRAAAHPFITGSSVRGALAARWLRQNGHLVPGRPPQPIADPHERQQFFRVFESGAVRFPFLFPSSPAPLSRHSCKRDPTHPVVDLLDPRHPGGGPVRCTVARCDGRLDRAPGTPESVTLQVRARTAIDDDGVAAAGMLYAQQELDEGQLFSGWMAAELTPGELSKWVPVGETFEVSVGADTSTSGLVRLSVTPQEFGPYGTGLAARRAGWLAVGLADDVVVLTARSPLVLTDRWLRPAARFDRVVLEDALGLGEVKVLAFTSARTRPAGGWNPAAGIPKPTDLAIVEGSVAQVRVGAPLHDPDILDRLAEVEAAGLGWRRAEGFGAVMLWSGEHLHGAVAAAP